MFSTSKPVYWQTSRTVFQFQTLRASPSFVAPSSWRQVAKAGEATASTVPVPGLALLVFLSDDLPLVISMGCLRLISSIPGLSYALEHELQTSRLRHVVEHLQDPPAGFQVFVGPCVSTAIYATISKGPLSERNPRVGFHPRCRSGKRLDGIYFNGTRAIRARKNLERI